MAVGQNILQITSSLPDQVKLVAVSKFQPHELIQEAYDVGQRIFGESRVQELIAKQPLLPADIEWHFIGPLQTNKVKYIAPFIHMIQSIDSLKLLQEVDRQAAKNNRIIDILLEIRVAKEETKHGFQTKECLDLFEKNIFSTYANIKIAGLMGMASNTENLSRINKEFSELQQLFNKIKYSNFANENFSELSMGMSNDYLIAIQNGSTMIRIGSSIFGE